MKGMLFLGTALLLAAPALAADMNTGATAGSTVETDASMNHNNTSDPKNPAYDAPTTSTSAADANSNVSDGDNTTDRNGDAVSTEVKGGANAGAPGASSSGGSTVETDASMNHNNTADPKNPAYDAPTTSTSAASGAAGDGSASTTTSTDTATPNASTDASTSTSADTSADMSASKPVKHTKHRVRHDEAAANATTAELNRKAAAMAAGNAATSTNAPMMQDAPAN